MLGARPLGRVDSVFLKRGASSSFLLLRRGLAKLTAAPAKRRFFFFFFNFNFLILILKKNKKKTLSLFFLSVLSTPPLPEKENTHAQRNEEQKGKHRNWAFSSFFSSLLSLPCFFFLSLAHQLSSPLSLSLSVPPLFFTLRRHLLLRHVHGHRRRGVVVGSSSGVVGIGGRGRPRPLRLLAVVVVLLWRHARRPRPAAALLPGAAASPGLRPAPFLLLLLLGLDQPDQRVAPPRQLLRRARLEVPVEAEAVRGARVRLELLPAAVAELLDRAEDEAVLLLGVGLALVGACCGCGGGGGVVVVWW